MIRRRYRFVWTGAGWSVVCRRRRRYFALTLLEAEQWVKLYG